MYWRWQGNFLTSTGSVISCVGTSEALDAAMPAGLLKALPVHAYLFLFHLKDADSRGLRRSHGRPLYREHSRQLGLSVRAMEPAQLARRYPQASGRDIKGLTKLVAKFCQHKALAPTLEVFARCAMFRALDPTSVEA